MEIDKLQTFTLSEGEFLAISIPEKPNGSVYSKEELDAMAEALDKKFGVGKCIVLAPGVDLKKIKYITQ